MRLPADELSPVSERARMREVEPRVARARLITLALFAVVVLVASAEQRSWFLPVTGGALVLAGAAFAVIRRRLPRSPHPERWVAAAFAVSQVAIAATVALTGGPASPFLVWLVVPSVALAARHGWRGTAVGAGFALLTLVGATFVAHPDASSADPTAPLAAAAALVAVVAFATAIARTELEHRTASALDPLTGLLSRRTLHERFAEIAEQARASRQSVCLLLVDLDGFKALNDVRGHQAGDDALRAAAGAMRSQLRSFELAYRLGGDELLVVLPGASASDGARLAERLRAALARALPDGTTASVGVAHARGEAVALDALYEAADVAMYAAKRDGGDRIAVAGDDRPAVLAA